jgi:hypothetical protein
MAFYWMEHNEQELIRQSIQQEWGVELAGLVSEQEILNKLALQIGHIAAQGPDTFFQLMYRLDIPEKQLVSAMHDKQVALEIARLVYNRQLQKIRSREYYKNKPDAPSDLSW